MPIGLARSAQRAVAAGGGNVLAEGGGGWSLTGASYDSKSFSVTSQEATPKGITFKDDGTIMYVAGNTTDDVFQYTLGTAWDVSTASYASKSYAFGSTNLSGLSIDSTGVYMYATFQSASSNIRTVKLATAWDLGSVSSWNNYTANASQDTNPRGIFIGNSNGNFYIGGDTGDAIYQYSLSPAGPDKITAGSVTYQQSFSVSTTAINPNGVFFKPDGTVMFVLSQAGANSEVQRYTLSTAWDISTATASTTLVVSSQTTAPTDFYFKPDGLKMYIVANNGTVYQYSLT